MHLFIGLLIALTFEVSEGHSWYSANECEELYASVLELPDLARADEDELWDALALFRETRTCFGDRSPSRVHWLLLREISVLFSLGYLREALDVTDTLLVELESHPDPTTTSRTYQWRGYVHYQMGDLTQAVSNYASSLAYATEGSLVRKAQLYKDIAVVYQRMGDFRTARHYLDQGLLLVNTDVPASSDVQRVHARLLAQKADHLLADSNRPMLGRLDRAAELALESVNIWEELDDRFERGNALIILGEALSIRGHNEESLSSLEEAAQILEEAGDLGRQAAAVWKKGVALLRAGRYDDAERSLNQAVALAREAGRLDFQQRILTHLGALSAYQGEFERAEHYKTLAVAVTEAYRAPLRGTEWSPIAFGGWQDPYRGRVRTLLAQEKYAEAFRALEQMRARHLDDLHQQQRIVSHLADADRARFDSLTSVLVDLRTALASDTTTAAVTERLRLEESRLQAARSALLDLEDEQPDLDLPALQDVLADQGRVLVSYFLDWDHEFVDIGHRSHIFVITGDTLIAEPLDVTVSEVGEMVSSVSPVLDIDTRSQHGLNEQQFGLDVLHALYDRLIAPIAEHLPDGVALAIVPDGPLFGFPFGMLVEEETPRFRYHDAPFLLRRHPLSVQLTARALVHDTPERDTDHRLDLVALGQSSYQEWVPATLAGVVGSDSLVDLPSVPDEVQGIARLLRRTNVLVDTEATKTNLQREARQTSVLHIASHTAFSSLSPFYNALLLGGRADTDGEGVVFLHELQQWEVGADLVVLSGCDTGRGVLMGGDGMASLQYAFHSLGVPSTVATLWLVDDRAVAELMQRFYRHLRSGLPKDVALQRAQLDYLAAAEGPRASPFFWASPVLYGDTSPLDLAPRRFYQAAWIPYLIGVLLVLMAAGVLWHRRTR